MPKFDWSNLAPFVTAVKTACGAGAMKMGEEVVNDVKRHFGSHGRYKSSPPGMPPNKQRSSGGLAGRMQVQASGRLSAIVGSNIEYAAIHEFGGIIRAKKSKFLPVPLNTSARAMLEDGGSLRTKGDFTVISPNFGRTLLLVAQAKFAAKANVTGADGKRKYKTIENTQPRFILKKSVRMPKRPYMAPALKRARNNAGLTNTFAVGTTKSLMKSGFKVKVVPA